MDDALALVAPDPAKGSIADQFPGVYDDPLEFAQQVKRGSILQWLAMVVRNRVMSIRMNRKVRRLRDGS